MSSSWLDSWGSSWDGSWGEIVDVPGAMRGVSHGTSSTNGSITAKAWIYGNIECLSGAFGVIDFIQNETEINAGSGHPSISAFVSPTGIKHKKSVEQSINQAIQDIYKGITENSPQKVKKQAANIVKTFVVSGIKPIAIPLVNVINWEALEKDAAKVSALLELWQEQIDLEDEEMLLMLIAA